MAGNGEEIRDYGWQEFRKKILNKRIKVLQFDEEEYEGKVVDTTDNEHLILNTGKVKVAISLKNVKSIEVLKDER